MILILWYSFEKKSRYKHSTLVYEFNSSYHYVYNQFLSIINLTHSFEQCCFSLLFFLLHIFFFNLIFNLLIEIFRAILRRGFAFSASIKNPPLLKSRNIQSQTSITANVPVPTITNTQQPGIAAIPQQTTIEQTAFQVKDTSKLQHHTSTTPGAMATTVTSAAVAAAGAKQVQQKLSNESIHDLATGSSNIQQTKNEHIVWPKKNCKPINISSTKSKQIFSGVKKLWSGIRRHVLGIYVESKEKRWIWSNMNWPCPFMN